jgi:hypothetical protein
MELLRRVADEKSSIPRRNWSSPFNAVVIRNIPAVQNICSLQVHDLPF